MPPASSHAECFALLDDCTAGPSAPQSRLYTGFVRSIACPSAAKLPVALDALQEALAAGLHAVLLFSYELGADLQGIAARPAPGWPSEILLFDTCTRLTAAAADAWLAERAGTAAAGVTRIESSVDAQQFETALARIHAYIEAGDTYQINYTYRLRFDAYGEPAALYRRLRARQPVPYAAFVAMPDGRAVLSLSPELFVRHERGVLTARPMKGTAAASGDAEEDALRADALARDPKNRAENLMIVDLLRNDLGRIAEFGSVQVPHLFRVERFSSVLQMTSTVQATLRDGATLAEVFAALYPCGSITGAPKRRTMEIIRELEPDARGLYTGAIGWFDAPQPGAPLGDFCLSVPIRTVVLQPPAHGVRAGELGVGAGIVHDSVTGDEFEECRLKARFLTGLPHGFELFETMLATREEGCRLADLHLERLARSAQYFGMPYDAQALRRELAACVAALPPATPHRLRLALQPDGRIALQAAAIAPMNEPVRVLLAPEVTRADDLFLRHKSAVRARYDAAWRAAEAQGAFDMLFFNERGELTEGGRSSVFLKLDGRWWTPPVSCGLLPGVMRSVLLADPDWQAGERVLTRADLERAEEIVICNALRGALRAVL